MRLIESFSEWLSHQDSLNEASNDIGILLLLASTDPDNLKASKAEVMGVTQDTEWAGTLNGVDDLLEIGKTKKLDTKLQKGKKVGAGVDYITMKVDGKTYSIKESGLIQVPIKRNSVIEFKGAGNGLLALGRLCGYLAESVERGFDPKSDFSGTIFVRLSDKARRGEAYFINAKGSPIMSVRYSDGYTRALNTFDSEFPIMEAEDQTVDRLSTVGDTLADAIKAAQLVAAGQDWKSNFSAFKGFKDMEKSMEKAGGMEWKGSTEQDKRLDKASWMLSTVIHWFMDILCPADPEERAYPFDRSKIYKIDIQPQVREMLKAQGGDPKTQNPDALKSSLEKIVDLFALKKLPQYPEFTAKMPDFWNTFKAFLTGRVLATIPKSYGEAMKAQSGSGRYQTTGGGKGGKRTYKSGEID